MSREAMQLALEALESDPISHAGLVSRKQAITILRQALETEPFEYWNAVEGWVKIDEVREHFDAVGCGTIYKSAGEGRSPLYTAPRDSDNTAQRTVDKIKGREMTTMDDAIAAGDGVLMNEQAALLRECRMALDHLLRDKPMLAAKVCGTTTLGNLRAMLHEYRPQGVFGGMK